MSNIIGMGKRLLAASAITMIISAAIVTLLPGPSSATYRIPSAVALKTPQAITPGKQVFQKPLANDTQWAYFVYVPPTYDTNSTKRWPLLIFHMVNEELYNPAGDNISKMYDSGRGGMNGSIMYDLVEPARTLPYLGDRFIVVTPFVDMFCNSNNGQPGRLMGLYKYLISKLKVDTTRISMMGHCAGGGIVVEFAEEYPKFPAAIVAMSCNDNWRSTIDITKLCNIRDIPYQHYADKTDPMVPQAAQQAIYDKVVSCGGTKMTITWQDKGQHEIWGLSNLDQSKAMYDWMLAQQKPVSVVPGTSKHQNTKLSLDNLSANDRVEVVGLNGQVLLRSQGNNANINRRLNELKIGVHIVRIYRGDQTVEQVVLPRR